MTPDLKAIIAEIEALNPMNTGYQQRNLARAIVQKYADRPAVHWLQSEEVVDAVARAIHKASGVLHPLGQIAYEKEARAALNIIVEKLLAPPARASICLDAQNGAEMSVNSDGK